jgi:hypothetical protein
MSIVEKKATFFWENIKEIMKISNIKRRTNICNTKYRKGG